MRLSRFCFTRAVAIISDPIIKKTASFINDLDISSGVPIPKTTSITMIYRAIAGSGIVSVIIIIRAVMTIIIIRYPSKVSPEGAGNRNRMVPTSMVVRNHFFWVAQKRKLIKEWFEKPSIAGYNLVSIINQ